MLLWTNEFDNVFMEVLSDDIQFCMYIQDGHTAIHFASQKGYSEIVEMLLKANAKIDLTNKVSYLVYN